MKAITAKTKNVMAAFDAYQTVEQAAQEGSPAMALFSGQAGLRQNNGRRISVCSS